MISRLRRTFVTNIHQTVLRNQKPFSALPRTDIYIVDSNLVIGYINEDLAGWKAWADTYIGLGKKFYMLPQTVREVSVKHNHFPPGFEELRLELEMFEKSQKNLDSVYNQIVKELKIPEKKAKALKTDIELIAEAGYYAGFAIQSQINYRDILEDRVVFASANFAAIKAVVYTKEQRDIVEKILDDSAFEHLITVRMISSSKETWIDFF